MTRFRPLPNPSTFRKMAAAMWRPPNDPTIYGTVDVEATAMLAFLERHRAEHPEARATVAHLVTAALARALAHHPELNAKVRLWGRLELRDEVVVSLQVASDDGRDLGIVRLEGADKLSLEAISERVREQAALVRREDERYELAKTRSLLKQMPWWLMRPVLAVTDVLTNELHIHVPSQGLLRDTFGSAMVTNVGVFGVDTAFAPFTPIARCPIIVLVTEVKQRPWVVEDRVEPRPVLRLCATFDHRIIDGAHAGHLGAEVRAILESAPESLAQP
ncbi:MAG: 2-oxo acid dehydrogenase subunit E2 [Myxococcales bacterium]|nr:2-oxo acid dehydrogenase subunit E2 [Myxococcales bacterium]